jgi:hypothetical protein
MATGTDVAGLATSSAAADVIKTLPDQEVRVDASPAVATDIARVGGKLHIFFANFDGLVGGQNAVQTPQKGIRVTIPAAGTGKAWFLPSLARPWKSRPSATAASSCSYCRTFRKARSSGSSSRDSVAALRAEDYGLAVRTATNDTCSSVG